MKKCYLLVGLTYCWSVGFAQDDEHRDFRYQVALHGIYMVPDGVQASDYSRPGFGLGGTCIFPIGSIPEVVRAGAGFEFVNLLSKSRDFIEANTGFPFTQETNQNFWRVYAGLHVGTRGDVLFRPYASLNIALTVHSIVAEVVVKDQYDSTKEVRRITGSDHTLVAGFDGTFGIDLNVSRLLAVDGGFRFVKSFAVPQQLGEGSVRIYPHYYQIFLGVRGQGLLGF
jgi:hypothetical protein